MATSFPVSANTRPAVQQIDQLINALRKAGKEAGMTDKEIDDLVNSTRKLGREGVSQIGGINKQFNNLANDGLKRAGAALLTFLAVDRAKELIKQIVDITAQFQKFEAILTNTLGSKSQARIALREIAEFAAKTPFGVAQLTENFIKLANRGVKPTMDQMRGLGDLSATLGKDVEQLVEALLDVNNPERWKELGIVSQTAGDKVMLSFRGMTIEADKTVKGVTEAAVKLGEMEGVAGSMAAVSVTLGGAISNAEDSIDALFNTLGDGNKGVLLETVNLFTRAVEAANELVKTEGQRQEDLNLDTQKNALEYFKLYLKGYDDVDMAKEAFMADQKLIIDSLEEEYQAVAKLGYGKRDLLDKIMGTNQEVDKENQRRLESRKQLNAQMIAYQGVEEAIDEYIRTLEKAAKVEVDLEEQRMIREMIARQNAKKVRPGAGLTMPTVQGLDGDGMLAGLFGKMMEKDRTEFQKENAEDRADIYNKEFEHRAMLEQSYYDFSMDLARTYLEGRRALIAQEMDELQEARRHEVEMAGKNGEAVDNINRKFAERERQLRSKQARDQQAQALFGILVNQGPAVAKTIATLGFPAALPFIGLVLAQFALQSRFTNALKAPKFATGVYDLDGPGTSTSDSIPAFLSRGEDVIPADRNKKFGFFLKEIIENPALDLWDVKSMIDQKIPNQYATVFVNSAKGADSDELAREMRATREAMRNLKQVNVTVDEHGFQKWTVEGNKYAQYVNTRYKF